MSSSCRKHYSRSCASPRFRLGLVHPLGRRGFPRACEDERGAKAKSPDEVDETQRHLNIAGIPERCNLCLSVFLVGSTQSFSHRDRMISHCWLDNPLRRFRRTKTSDSENNELERPIVT